MLEVLQDLLSELKTIKINISKDNVNRREDISVINSWENRVNELSNKFSTTKQTLTTSKIKEHELLDLNAIVVQFQKIKAEVLDILRSRLKSVQPLNMSEKFDLKTATSLFQTIDNREESIKQLIDNMQFYSELLNPEGKHTLKNFILKCKLSQKAKLKLQQDYDTVELLIKDMKRLLLTEKSAVTISTLLNNAKQGGKSIQKFGEEIEDLVTRLTIVQAENNIEAIPILRKVNEKMAINIFCNGLTNNTLKTIVKARSSESLRKLIQATFEEEVNMGGHTNTETNIAYYSKVSHNKNSQRFNSNNSKSGSYNANRGRKFFRGQRYKQASS